FLGLTLDDKVPHFTTYGKNYSRRFAETELITRIFEHVLHLYLTASLVDTDEIFIDGTQIKAAANNHKNRRQEVEAQAKWMSEQLDKEIAQDRIKHGKKPIKPATKGEAKTQKMSMTAKLSLPFSQS
ncbi:transposase, partial [Streptococcus pneumoniae]